MRNTDYMMRMYEVGLKMYMNQSVIINHLVAQTKEKDGEHQKLYEQSRQIFAHKHVETKLQDRFHELYNGVTLKGEPTYDTGE